MKKMLLATLAFFAGVTVAYTIVPAATAQEEKSYECAAFLYDNYHILDKENAWRPFRKQNVSFRLPPGFVPVGGGPTGTSGTIIACR